MNGSASLGLEEDSIGANLSMWHGLYTDALGVVDAAAPFLLPSRALLLRSHLLVQIATHYHGTVSTEGAAASPLLL
jgi:hypothetical protein